MPISLQYIFRKSYLHIKNVIMISISGNVDDDLYLKVKL